MTPGGTPECSPSKLHHVLCIATAQVRESIRLASVVVGMILILAKAI